jgi:predicted DNA-binding WGR domain protein
MTAIMLHRIDSSQNMRHFYRLDIQPDLFGGFLLMKQWGRFGSFGRIKAERYDNEMLASAALQRQADRKRRKGYGDAFSTLPRMSLALQALQRGNRCPKQTLMNS